MPNYFVIICCACDANATARNSLLSSPPIISVDERDQYYDAKSNPVMQLRSWPPIRNQFMHQLHHNIVSRAWSYLLLSAPPPPPAYLSLTTNIIIAAPQIHIRTSSLQVRFVLRNGTLHTQDISSKDNTANADTPDIDIPIWFDLHCLPYNYVIVTKLQIIGKYLCVEDLKLFKPHHIEALFGEEDYIVIKRSELAWEDLGGRDQYSFKKPKPNLNNSTKTNSDPARSDSTASPSTNKNKTNVIHKHRMPSIF